MNEIISINYDTPDRPTVSGRELHKALEIGTAYKDWFPRMCEYGFVEGKDYTPIIFEPPRTNSLAQTTSLLSTWRKNCA